MDANTLISQSQHSLIVRSIKMREGEHDAPHLHPWHQVLLPGSGVLKTRTQHKEYYVPFNRAVLIPANCQHESWAITAAEFIGVYIKPEQLPWLSSPLLYVWGKR